MIPSTQQQHYHRLTSALEKPRRPLGPILCQIRPLKTKAMEDPDPLCCCEYQNTHGERAHLLGLFCDCEQINTIKSFDITVIQIYIVLLAERI